MQNQRVWFANFAGYKVNCSLKFAELKYTVIVPQ